MITAAAVANEFLQIQKEDTNSSSIDHMKLQKLVYYAHAWYLAIHDQPLFEDDIEAWPWGPVVRNLYIEFKEFGSNPIINKFAQILKKSKDDGASEWSVVTPFIIDPEKKEFIKEIWNTHKIFSGIQLSNATHAEGEPWTIVRKFKNGNLSDKPKIENELIKAVFQSKMKLNAPNSSAK